MHVPATVHHARQEKFVESVNFSIGENLAKYWEGWCQSIWDTTPRTAKGRVGVGMEEDMIGLGSE